MTTGRRFSTSVTPVFSAADIAFGNLEGVLMDGGEAVKRCRPAKATTKRRRPPPAPASLAPPAPAAGPARRPRVDDGAIAAVPDRRRRPAARPRADAPGGNAHRDAGQRTRRTRQHRRAGTTAQPAPPGHRPRPAVSAAAPTPPPPPTPQPTPLPPAAPASSSVRPRATPPGCATPAST